MAINANAVMIIKSSVPVGYTERIKAKGIKVVVFEPPCVRLVVASNIK